MTDRRAIGSARAAIPLGHMAEPSELVPTVLFLCSQGAAYITGQTMHVNGGSWMV